MASLSPHIQILNTGLTARDSCLKNPDLLTQTFSHLQFENDKEYRLCLFNVALTCKDFLDVALNALWKELDSLVPLLRLSPALRVEDEAYVLSGDVSRADWDRVEIYSRRVKVFHAMKPDAQRPQIALSTYIRIAQLQSSFFLPSLRHLRCSLGVRSMSHIFLFISPSLESLELTNIAKSENHLVRPFLDSLPSPILSRIVLRTGQLSADTLKSITRFKQLRSLELSDAILMDGFVVREILGALPSLVNLTLKAISSGSDSGYVSEKSNSKGGGPKCFNALENLCVTGSLVLIRDLLEIIESPCLKSIEIHPSINWRIITRPSKPDTEPDDLTRAIAMIGSKWSSMEDLVIGQHNANHSEPPRVGNRYTFSKSIVDVLMGLHEMRTFHITEWSIGELHVTLSSLVTSWAKLTTLILPVDHMSTPFSILRNIAGNAPELRYLQIRLNLNSIIPPNPASATLRHKLGILSVGSNAYTSANITLQFQIYVARYLDSIFPCLESIKTHTGFQHETWSEVHDLVKLCQDVRQEAKRHNRALTNTNSTFLAIGSEDVIDVQNSSSIALV